MWQDLVLTLISIGIGGALIPLFHSVVFNNHITNEKTALFTSAFLILQGFVFYTLNLTLSMSASVTVGCMWLIIAKQSYVNRRVI